jgi:hypothetical protein
MRRHGRRIVSTRCALSRSIRAGLAASPDTWAWSTIRAHLQHRNDAVVHVPPVLELAPRFADLLEMSPDEQTAPESFVTQSRNGRPLGAPAFTAMAERKLNRRLQRGKPGPKPQTKRRDEMG